MWDDEEVPVCMECLHDIPGQLRCRCACHLDWEAATAAARALPPQSFPLAEAFVRVRGSDPGFLRHAAEQVRRELEDGHPGE